MWPTTRDARAYAPENPGETQNALLGAASDPVQTPRYSGAWRTFVLHENDMPEQDTCNDINLSGSWLQPMFYEDAFTGDQTADLTDHADVTGEIYENEEIGVTQELLVTDAAPEPPVISPAPKEPCNCGQTAPNLETQQVWIKTAGIPYKTTEEEFVKTRYPVVMDYTEQKAAYAVHDNAAGSGRSFSYGMTPAVPASGRSFGYGMTPAVPAGGRAVAVDAGGINIPDSVFYLLLFRLLGLCA